MAVALLVPFVGYIAALLNIAQAVLRVIAVVKVNLREKHKKNKCFLVVEPLRSG